MRISLAMAFIGFLGIGPVFTSNAATGVISPDCECVVTLNEFAASIPGQGVLTESIACTPNSPLYYCTAVGNLVWTPNANCCGTPADWWAAASSTYDSCNGIQSIACSGSTSNSHSCVAFCAEPPGSYMGFISIIYDCNAPSTLLKTVKKEYRCVVQ